MNVLTTKLIREEEGISASIFDVLPSFREGEQYFIVLE